MPAYITLDFDPIVRLGGFEVRAETIVLVGVVLAGLLLAARVAHLTPQPGPYVPAPPLAVGDMPFLVLGVVGGAVVGGRIEYVLLHLDYYAANPSAIIDPSQGALALSLAVLGGIGGGLAIARLVGAPAGAWMHASVLPLLFVLAAGQIAAVLAGAGQGAPSSLPWATAYVGPGPWASLAPGIASHPAQVYEAAGTALVLGVLGLVIRAGAFARRDGSALLVGLIAWALVRGVVVTTWRDAPVLGPIRAEHLVLAAVLVVCLGGLTRLRRSSSASIA